MRTKLFIFSLLFIMCSCADKQEMRIPSVRVYCNIDFITARYKNLQSLGYGEAYEKGFYQTDYMGYSGLYVVHTLLDEYVAFDLCCPVECRKDVRLSKIDSTEEVECKECGSLFQVIDGTGCPKSGIANEKGYFLKRYAVREKENGLLVTN